MTSLVIEDGTGLPNSNTYVAAATITAFATARGITLTTDATLLAVESMDYIESLLYKGLKRTMTQALQFPRLSLFIDGYLYPSSQIPQQLLDGQCWTAIAIDQGTDFLQDAQRRTSMEKVGSIEVQYAKGAAANVYNRHINAAMWKILDGGSGFGVKVSKA